MPRYKRTRAEDVEEDGRSKKPSRQQEGKVLETSSSQMVPPGPVTEDPTALLSSPRVAHPANAPLRAQAVAALQRLTGNAYVQRLLHPRALQAKLTVNPPDDEYEREADRVAEQITRTHEPDVHRQATEDTEAEEPAPMKPLADATPQLMQRQAEGEEEEEEEEAEEEEALQTKGEPGLTGKVPSDVEDRIRTAKGSGQPLPPSTRALFEPRFGLDFAGVRIHTDDTADALSEELKARAFTTGRDIFFREGAYDPASEEGKQLLGHELTHVVQQTAPSNSSARDGQAAHETQIARVDDDDEEEEQRPTEEREGGATEATEQQATEEREGGATETTEQQASEEQPRVAAGMTEAQFSTDWRAADVRQQLYFRHFENTVSNAEACYSEAIRRFEQHSRQQTSGWRTVLGNLFIAALGLIPALGPIFNAIQRVRQRSEFFAEGLKELIKFGATTIANYAGAIPNVLALRTPFAARRTQSAPELFQELRRVRSSEMSSVGMIMDGWNIAHDRATEEGRPWTARLAPRFRADLNPITALGEDADFIRDFERQLWERYFREKVQRYIAPVRTRTGIVPMFYFRGLNRTQVSYLRDRFGWTIYDLVPMAGRQRSTVHAFELWLFWNQIPPE